jgi:hypothetical protein
MEQALCSRRLAVAILIFLARHAGGVLLIAGVTAGRSYKD